MKLQIKINDMQLYLSGEGERFIHSLITSGTGFIERSFRIFASPDRLEQIALIVTAEKEINKIEVKLLEDDLSVLRTFNMKGFNNMYTELYNDFTSEGYLDIKIQMVRGE